MQFTQGADEYEEGEDYFDLYITGTQVEDGPYLEEEHDSTGERNESTSIARVEPNYEDMLIVEEKEEDEEVQPVPQQASPLVNQAEELDNEAVESSKLDELLLDSDEEAMQSQVDGEVAESYSPEYMSLQVSQTENQHEEALSSNNENDNNEDNDNNIDADKGMNSSDIIPAVESSTLHLSKKSVSFHQEEEEEEEVGEGEEEEEDEMEVEVSQTQVQEEEGDGDITNPTVTDEISRSNFISSPIIQMNKQSTPVVDKEEELANNDINSEDDHGDGEPSGEDDFDVQVSQTQANVEPVISGHHQFHQNEQAPEEQDEIKAEEDSDDFEIHVSQTQLPEEGVVLGKDSTDSSRQVSPVIVQVAAERSPENFSIYDITPSSPGIPTATTTTTPKQKANNTSRRFEESPTQIDTYYRSPELATNRKLAQPHINPVESSNTAVTGKISVNPTIRPTEESSIEWLNSRRVFNEVGLPSTSLVDNKKGQIKQYEEILDDMELHLSQSVDRSAEDLAILQDEYARKLQELLAMKKTIESASKSKNSLSVPSSVAKEAKPGASSNKEHDNVSFGFGTLECANILIDINKSIEDTSNNVASSPLMVDVSSPARFPDIVGLKSSDGISANNTSSAPSRKFNTSFAALPSSSKVTPNEPKDNIPNTSGERLSSGKFRRRYAATNNLSPDPTAKSAVIDLSASEKLFEFPGAEEEEVDLSSTTNKKQEVQLKRDNIKNFANDAVSDEDEEFDEHQTKATSSVQKDSIIALSTNQKAVKIMNINKDEALLKHLSAQLLHNGLPQKWAKLWSQLESVGWYWTKGKGLISFYYIRPNAKGANPYVMNRDYFPSGEDVVKYLKQFVYEEHEVAKQQASLQVTSLSSSSSKKVTIAVNKDGDEQDSSMSSSSSALLKKQRLIKPMKRVIDDDAGWNDEDDARLLAEHHGKGKQQPQQSKPDESHKASTSAFSSPASVMDDNGAMDIRSIPWKDLWKILRGLGWSWDFGPSHLNYYYRPGYDSKKDKEAILGEHKFENDDSIRRYIRKQIKNGNAREWSMFFVSNLHRNDSIQESQQAEAHIRDPSWTLTTHRKRRESHNQSHVTDALDDHLDDGDDSASDDFASHKPNKRLSNNNSKASSVKSNKRKSVAEHQSKSTKRYSNNDYEEMTQAQVCICCCF